ncbi:MAG: hypothetical protein HQL74_11040 [Magnetococcales bacterium]|nr:hypothetical protein [Magnetococcales bacterium]
MANTKDGFMMKKKRYYCARLEVKTFDPDFCSIYRNRTDPMDSGQINFGCNNCEDTLQFIGEVDPESLVGDHVRDLPRIKPTSYSISNPTPISPKTKPKPMLKPKPTPTLEPDPEQIPEPTLEPVPEPTLESIPEPTLESVSEPILESIPEPTLESVSEPILEPAPEPTLESVSEPILEPAPEPTLESVSEPILESTPDLILAPTPEVSKKIISKPMKSQKTLERNGKMSKIPDKNKISTKVRDDARVDKFQPEQKNSRPVNRQHSRGISDNRRFQTDLIPVNDPLVEFMEGICKTSGLSMGFIVESALRLFQRSRIHERNNHQKKNPLHPNQNEGSDSLE